MLESSMYIARPAALHTWRGLQQHGTLAIACLAIAALPAWADPTVELPPTGRATIVKHPDGSPRLVLLGEAQILAIARAGEASTYPEVDAIDSRSLDLALARLGIIGKGSEVSFSLRIDASEALRTTTDDLSAEPMATIDAFLDDAAIFWTPREWASAIVGRYSVPFSRFRYLEPSSLTTGAVPFAVDRRAPDRRWGATLFGDLGGIAYATGLYADLDALEPGRDELDPSQTGELLATAYVGWTPRAPIGADHMAVPASDPWFDTGLPAAGVGMLWRRREQGDRFDVSLNGQLKYRHLAAIGEGFLYIDGDEIGVALAVQASALLFDRVALVIVGDYDMESAFWSTGGGASLFVTADRKTKVSILGFVRKNTQDGQAGDAALLVLHAFL